MTPRRSGGSNRAAADPPASNKNAHFCGGSYIEDENGCMWVVTAAHCVLAV